MILAHSTSWGHWFEPSTAHFDHVRREGRNLPRELDTPPGTGIVVAWRIVSRQLVGKAGVAISQLVLWSR